MDITYKLPHPVRITCSKYTEMCTQAMDQVYDEVFTGLDIETSSIDYLTQTMMTLRPDIFSLHRSENLTDHMAGIALSTTLHSYKFRRQDGNILTTSDFLDEILEQTEIGDDVPVDYLRPPFKACYIEFTESRSSSLKVYNELTHEHILEGVYISETQINPGSTEMKRYKDSPMVDINKPLRILDLMFTGSPLGKAHVEDDTLRVQGFYIQDGMRTIKQELSRVEEKYGQDDDFTGDMNYLSETLNHMAKVLLFINCKQYRDTAFNERKELRKKITSLKGIGKIRKFEDKLRKTYDRVVISPVDNVVYESDAGFNHARNVKEKRTHWRKGHFRMQPYGLGASKRKILFIEPTVVGGVFAKKKNYDVKEKTASP